MQINLQITEYSKLVNLYKISINSDLDIPLLNSNELYLTDLN